MKTIDLTEGRTPNIKEGEEYQLTVTFHNGQRYCYYGSTKKEAELQFKKKWGNFKGFIEKEWDIV
jgi:hypothetical protein